jgi:hypothetical protein
LDGGIVSLADGRVLCWVDAMAFRWGVEMVLEAETGLNVETLRWVVAMASRAEIGLHMAVRAPHEVSALRHTAM